MPEIKGYFCSREKCDKRWCWSPGRFEHRGATKSGSHNTGNFSKTCMHNAYHGCPHPIPEINESHQDWVKRLSAPGKEQECFTH